MSVSLIENRWWSRTKISFCRVYTFPILVSYSDCASILRFFSLLCNSAFLSSQALYSIALIALWLLVPLIALCYSEQRRRSYWILKWFSSTEHKRTCRGVSAPSQSFVDFWLLSVYFLMISFPLWILIFAWTRPPDSARYVACIQSRFVWQLFLLVGVPVKTYHSYTLFVVYCCVSPDTKKCLLFSGCVHDGHVLAPWCISWSLLPTGSHPWMYFFSVFLFC